MAFVQGGGSNTTTTSNSLSRKTRTSWVRAVKKAIPRPPSTTSSSTSTRSTSSGNTYYSGSSYRSTPSTYTQTTRTSAADRAQTRQEARDEHRQYVEGVRGRNQELRRDRAKSLLNPVENSLLGSPWGIQDELPKFIGERWNRGADQSIADITWTPVQFGNADVTADTIGYNQMYDSTNYAVYIPSGLDGVWLITVGMRFASNTTGSRQLRVEVNGTTQIIDHITPATSGNISYSASAHYVLAAGDYFDVQVRQNSGGALNLLGGRSYTWVSYQFCGTGGY